MDYLGRCMGCRCWQQGVSRGVLCGKRSRVAPCHTQPPSTDLPQGTGWSHQTSWWHIWENIFKKGQKMSHRENSGGLKMWAKLVWSPRSETEGGEVLQTPKQRFPAAHGGPQWNRHPRCSPRRGPCWNRGKAWRGGNSREELLWMDHKPHYPSPCNHQVQRRQRSQKWRTETECRKMWAKMVF